MDYDTIIQHLFKREFVCAKASVELLNKLRKNSKLESIYAFPSFSPSKQPKSNFHLVLTNPIDIMHDSKKTTITGISIAYPIDIWGNKGVDYGDSPEPTVIETCLISFGSLCYVDVLGYSDVKRFFSIDELIDELVQIGNRGI